ncbi:DUF2829 domain-containing protein [Hymenobacter sp. M29]|uniref:DUF2829 domain-containing protein n=1 Tax=Hymenobacter mellowenesis TaxID=3063995 RepID=A0ABT9ACM1_9BACT|nr:MW1434 family type I TA system toxin [Hymenobacter sp. M29]MDO7847604.1 DUF2829 domain-containing protein [Hymenobacter sp. M29]
MITGFTSQGIDFGHALAALKTGKKVTRQIWGGYWRMDACSVSFPEGKAQDFTVIMAYLKDGGVAPAQPYQSDLLATDWVILD